MIKLTLNEEQVQLISKSREIVELLDEHGNLVGYFHPAWSDRDIRIALDRRRHPGPWLTTPEVLGCLNDR